MHFTVLSRGSYPPSDSRNAAFLIEDRWDDWRKYKTQFRLVVFDHEGREYSAGDVKIGQKGLAPSEEISPGHRAPALPPTFESLDDSFISLGQDQNYYETLNTIPGGVATTILVALRDCAYDLAILEFFKNEEVLGESLLRSVSSDNLQKKFSRLARGDAALNEFYFEYQLPPNGGSEPPPKLAFHVEPSSTPPTNVHVIIGRNGVGKTRLMKAISRALLLKDPDVETSGMIDVRSDFRPTIPLPDSDGWSFAGVVAVTFSAFDSFSLPPATRKGMRSEIIGLFQNAEREEEPSSGTDPEAAPKSFADAFCNSFGRCRSGPRKNRLQHAISTLANDPLFAEAAIEELMAMPDDQWRDAAKTLFERLSSGHAIVLLTMTRLVELVDERTVVLMDEPEAHLHPPLLSAFVRALSDLLTSRNGVALISTHSPVVLQEVPKSCVWKLRRTGKFAAADRPTIETFGENVGILTREVFELEVTTSGFHNLLQQAVENSQDDYDTVLAKFSNQLGAEARGIVRSFLAIREKEQAEGGQ